MNGLMQEYPLTLAMPLRRMVRHHPDRPVIVRDGGVSRGTWGGIAEAALRMMAALTRIGVRPGARVASFAWNTPRHLELYFAVPCLGAVLHTLNIRLHHNHLAGIIRTSGDTVVFIDASLTSRISPIRATLPSGIQYVILNDDAPVDPAFRADPTYEELVNDESAPWPYENLPDIDERTAAILCHTSGTTGPPRGVLYSHRSEVLHALGACAADGFGVAEADTILLVAPMFHANGWGLPYAAALTGAGLVLPSSHTDPGSIIDVMVTEQVTLAAGVPTVWAAVADCLDQRPADLSSLRAILVGGAAPGEALLRRFASHGVQMLQGWGMTETSPNAALARPRPAVAATLADCLSLRATQGVAVPGVEVRVCSDNGEELPWDGFSPGELEVRGLWVANGYFPDGVGCPADSFHDGWLRTGDLATIDHHGYIRLIDRIKDLVKSGGEWISSLELEEHLAAHPGVREASVVAVPDDRWGERPVAVVVARNDGVNEAELREHLTGRVPTWWIPDAFVFRTQIPRTSVGKQDKERLRASLGRPPAGSTHRREPG